MPFNAISLQLSFHEHLGGDAGVVGSHLPEGVVTLHAMVANERIHDGLLKAVTHMQGASDIGGWNRDRERFFTALWREIAIFFPGLVPAVFYACGRKYFIHGDCPG